MTKKRPRFSRKQAIAAVVIALVIVLGTVVWWYSQRSPASSYVAQECSDYSGTYDSFGPGTISAIANDYSKAIVVATVEDPNQLGRSVHPEDSPPRIKVSQVLKGNDIREGDILPICPGMGRITLPAGEHPTGLVFIEGRDSNVWVPTWGYFGIVPQDANGRFTADWVQEGPRSVTSDELQKLIK
jgi:hypothetical protein